MANKEKSSKQKSASRRRLRERVSLGFSKGLVFVSVVALAVVLMQYKSYDAYDRFFNVRSIIWGASPSLNIWAVLAVFVLYVFLFARLIMSVLPAAKDRRRMAASLLFLPLAGIIFGFLDFSLVILTESYAKGLSAGNAAMFVAAGLLAALSASALSAQAATEGRGGVFSFPKNFIKIVPLALVVGALVYFLKLLSFYLVLLPFVGPALRATFNITLTLWFFGFLGKRTARGFVAETPRPPGPAFAYFFCFMSIIAVGMTVIIPGMPYHPDTEDVPSLAMVKNVLRPAIEDGENTVRMDTSELMLLIRKAPFSFALLDRDRNVLLKLHDKEGRSGDYQGIAMNLEPKTVAVSPWPDKLRTLTGKVRISSESFTAPRFSFDENSVSAEERFGVRPVTADFSFYDDDVLKITINPGASSPMRSVSMSVYAGKDERFLGIGRTGGGFNLKGREIDLLMGPETSDQEQGPGLISEITGGRFEFSSGGGSSWPAPFIYFSRGIGIFMTESVDGEIEVQTRYPDAVRFSSRGGAVTFYIISKKSPLKVLEKFHHMIPPRKRPDPHVLLPWSWTTRQDFCSGKAAKEMDTLRKHDIPAGGMYVSGLSAGQDGSVEDNCGKAAYARAFGHADKSGFALMADDVVHLDTDGPDYRYALENGLLAKNELDLPYHFLTEKGSRVVLDFTNPHTVKWRARKWKELAEKGVDAFALDHQCVLPPDALLYNNQSGHAMRNLYPEIYGRALQSSLDNKVIIASSLGYTRMETVASMTWPSEARGKDWRAIVREGVQNGVGPAMAGVQAAAAFGPSSLPSGVMEQEQMLLSKGLESMFPLFVLPGGVGRYSGNSGAPLGDLAKLSQTHSRLFPYFFSLAEKSVREGTPLAFHSGLLPGDAMLFEANDQFMLGGSLLVAFPEGPGQSETGVRFPKGEWTHLGSMEVYSEGARQVSYAGKRPLLFLREGHLLPLFDEPLQTIVQSGDTAGEAFFDQAINVTWSAGGPASFRLFDGAALSARMSADSMLFRVSGGAAREYSLRVLDCDKPGAVKANGELLEDYAWSYLERSRILRITGLKGPGLEVVMVME